jgi:hypothetical protein
MFTAVRTSRAPGSTNLFEDSGESFTDRNVIPGMWRQTGRAPSTGALHLAQHVPESTPRDTARASASRFVVTSVPRVGRIRCPHADVSQATAIPLALRVRVRQIVARFLHDDSTCASAARNERASNATAIHRSKNGLAKGGPCGVIKHVTTRATSTPRARAVSTFQSRELQPGSSTRMDVRGLGPAGAVGPASPSKSDLFVLSMEGCVSSEEQFLSLLRNATQDQGGPR